MTPSPEERIKAAMFFAEFGCRIVAVDGKNPGGLLGLGWQRFATRDPEVIRGWFTKWQTANVGILGDRALLPVDVDDPPGLDRLQRETVPAPETWRYYTGGDDPPGRERILFAYPGDDVLARVGRKLAPGVQLRHSHETNLMCLVPPSVHPVTGVVSDWRIRPDEVPLARIPEGWLARIRREPGEPIRSRDEWRAVLTSDHYPDDRHEVLMSLAAYLMTKFDGDWRIVNDLMLGFNQRHCKPPKPEEEISDIVAWLVVEERKKLEGR